MPSRSEDESGEPQGLDGFPLEQLVPSKELSHDLRQRAVEAFGDNGAWLLLSMLLYGWRVHYDLGVAVCTGALPVAASDARPSPPLTEFQISRDLQVQALIFGSAEQYLGLVRAARLHRHGTTRFFDAFVESPSVVRIAQELTDLEAEELVGLFRMPSSPEEVRPVLEDHLAHERSDDGETETTVIGGLYILNSTINSELCARMLGAGRQLIDLFLSNVDELSALVCLESDDDSGGMPRPQPLREIDNAFRHGPRMLFHSAVPSKRTFRAAGKVPGQGPFTVGLYMPKGEDTIKFGSVVCSPERTTDHLRALREVSTRTGQFVRGFLGASALETPAWLLSASGLTLPLPPTVADPCNEAIASD